MVSGRDLGCATSDRIRGLTPTVLVPVGSTEQHGPHLPLDTDTRIATAVATAVARAAESVVAPPICYGASGEHRGFPGTVSIGTEALVSLLVEYGRSACDWAGRLLFVNGHGGNVDALAAAVPRLRGEGRDVAWCPCASDGADAHAGHTETSLLLHLSPELVDSTRIRRGNTATLATLMPDLRRGGVAAVSEAGVLGDPTTASAAAGERILAEMTQDCAARLERWSPGSDGMLR